jgi:hypothetical protein
VTRLNDISILYVHTIMVHYELCSRLEILFTLRSTVRIARVVPPAPSLAHRVVGLRPYSTVISILFVASDTTDDVARRNTTLLYLLRVGATMAIMFSFRFLLLALLSTNVESFFNR